MYKLSLIPGSVIRLSDGTTIPFDVRNRDYQEYLVWAENNATEPADQLPDPGPTRDEKISSAIDAGQIELEKASSLDEVKTVMAGVLDVLKMAIS